MIPPFQFGESQKLRLVRILRSTVMVRVGGGWVALDEFLVKNDPCRGETSGRLTIITESPKDALKIPISNRILARSEQILLFAPLCPTLDHDDPRVQENVRLEAARLTRLIINHARNAARRRKTSAPASAASFVPFAYCPNDDPPHPPPPPPSSSPSPPQK